MQWLKAPFLFRQSWINIYFIAEFKLPNFYLFGDNLSWLIFHSDETFARVREAEISQSRVEKYLLSAFCPSQKMLYFLVPARPTRLDRPPPSRPSLHLQSWTSIEATQYNLGVEGLDQEMEWILQLDEKKESSVENGF